MSKKLFAVSVLVAALFNMIPNVVLAQDRDPIQMYADAGASTEQQAKIRELAHVFEASARVKSERAQNLLKKLQAFSLEPMPDEQTVLATQEEFNQTMNNLQMSRIKLMLQIRQVLSDEQRVKLVELLRMNKNAADVQRSMAQ